MRLQILKVSRKQYPVCILGAGPSGTTASLYFTQQKIPQLLIDKAVFPRDKICGDALSGKVVFTLNRVAPGLMDELVKLTKEKAFEGLFQAQDSE